MRYRHQLLHFGRQSSFQISLGWKTRLTSNMAHLHLHFGSSFENASHLTYDKIWIQISTQILMINDWRQNQNVSFLQQLWPGCLCSINLLGAVLSTKEGRRRRRHLSDKTLATCAINCALLYWTTDLCLKKQHYSLVILVFLLVLLQFAYSNSRQFNCVCL